MSARQDDRIDLRDRLSAFEVTGQGALVMEARARRSTDGVSTDADDFESVAVQDWTQPRPCPRCGEQARVHHIDVRRRVTTLTCYGCRRPFAVSAAELSLDVA